MLQEKVKMPIETLKKTISIDDSDIDWVESILGGGIVFDTERRTVIKNLDSVDIQAFPGSGKTTVLVAKLAILAKKWTSRSQGVCVLSHTNVARGEIEKRLGNYDFCKSLLSYPHFVGTLHSFFDTYVAIPYIRSHGISIALIDDDIVKQMRWRIITSNFQYSLGYKGFDESKCEYSSEFGSISLNMNKETASYKAVINAIKETQSKGFFTFNEMLLIADNVLDSYPFISSAIQNRFPFLFIDEAQDTNDRLNSMLMKVFNQDGFLSLQQRFGDCNQAIFSGFSNENANDFPRKDFLLIHQSKRFDERIAKLANTVAFASDQMSGTQNEFTDRTCCHTIFLFDSNSDGASRVIPEFGKLILDTFSDEELLNNKNYGCHVIGAIHNGSSISNEKQFPKSIADYWSDYSSIVNSSIKSYKSFLEYCKRGKLDMGYSQEYQDCLEWISKGLIRMINNTQRKEIITILGSPFSSLCRNLPVDKVIGFRKTLNNFIKVDFLALTEFDTNTCGIVDVLLGFFDTSLSSLRESGIKLNPHEPVSLTADNNESNNFANIFHYYDSISKRSVELEFGTIHSVKGRTHLATLILETFYRKHNIESILPFLCGNPVSEKNNKMNDSHRLKVQYVAMTRAKALLCLAIPKKSVDNGCREKLTDLGWVIKDI